MEKKYISLLIPLIIYGAMLFIYGYIEYMEYAEIIDICLNLFIITGFLFFFVRKFKVNGITDYFSLIVFCIYVFILHHKVFPFSVRPVLESTGIHDSFYLGVNLVPFQEIERFFRNVDGFSLQDPRTYFFIGNLLMFAPFAFILLYFRVMKPWKIIPLVCFLSIGVEVLQFVQALVYALFGGGIGRSADIDDVILNTTSALFGILAFQIYTKMSKPAFVEKAKSGRTAIYQDIKPSK